MAYSASKDNIRKFKHGANAKKSLQNAIESLKDYGAIIANVSNPRYGYEGFDGDQFEAHEEITYANGSKAVLFATSSLRSDRVQISQWRAHNIKKIDPNVTHAFVVLPDESGFDQGTSVRDKIRVGSVVSAIDDVLTVQELQDRIRDAYNASLGRGFANDLQGRKFETLFAEVLGNSENLKRYNGSEISTGYLYTLFAKVLIKLQISSGAVKEIKVTDNIPRLSNGGSPKTDVAAKLHFANGAEKEVTFSLKNTSNRSVSVHEYSADAFAQVLDPSNQELRRLLNAFQSVGNKRDMNPSDIRALTNELVPYRKKLNRWVFSGEGAPGALPIQIAQYIVVRDKNTGNVNIHSVDEYCAKQEAEIDGSNWFGTVFSWTYPSKKRGQKIQLKASILD